MFERIVAEAMLTERQSQIMRYGCPECGEPYNIVFSDRDGTCFECANKECKKYGIRVPEDKASANCPKKEKDIVAVEQMRLDTRDLRRTESDIKRLQESILNLKHRSVEEQDALNAWRKAYNEAKSLKLFKKGSRVYDENRPYLLFTPEGNLFRIKNIRSKRKAKTMCSAHLYFAREKFVKTMEEIANYRAGLRERKEMRRRLRLVLLGDKKNQKTSSKKGTKAEKGKSK